MQRRVSWFKASAIVKKDEVCYLSSGRLRYPPGNFAPFHHAASRFFVVPFFSLASNAALATFTIVVVVVSFLLRNHRYEELSKAVCVASASLLAALSLSRKRKRLERRPVLAMFPLLLCLRFRELSSPEGLIGRLIVRLKTLRQ